MGLISQLMGQGVQLILFDVQRGSVHFSDPIFAKDRRLHYVPIEEENAVKLTCSAGRDFLKKLGIQGEVLHTPGHSEDS